MNVRTLWSNLRTLLAAREPARLRALRHRWQQRSRASGIRLPRGLQLRFVAGFVVLFLFFLGLQIFALRISDIVQSQVRRVPGLTVSYSDAELQFFPPALLLGNVTVGGTMTNNERVRLDMVRIAPGFWALLRGQAGVSIAVTVGKGRATLDLEQSLFASQHATAFNLHAVALPLDAFSAITRFDPRAEGSFNVNAKGDIVWQEDKANGFFPRSCVGTVQGDVRLASLRNGIRALLLNRFEDATLSFGAELNGRGVTLNETRFMAPQLDVTLSGKAVLDWRSLKQTELNLLVEIKADAKEIMPQLVTPALRERLNSGQSLPIAVQGTLISPALTPVQ